MARIAGVDIPRDKRVVIGLTYIYGIGPTLSKKVLASASVNPDTRVRELTEEEVTRLREIIDRNFRVEGELRREIALNIKRLVEIGCYRAPDSANECCFPTLDDRARRSGQASICRSRCASLKPGGGGTIIYR